jgi:hypothetical protein
MKKMFLSLTTVVFLFVYSNEVQAQDTAKDLDQLKLAQKYWIGTWQLMNNETTYIWEFKQDGNVIMETDYSVVNGMKTAESYWTYSYNPESHNFYMFAANVKGGFDTLIGSFTAENKWKQEGFKIFNPDKYVGKGEFIFETPTSVTITGFNSEGTKIWEGKATKIK